MEQAKDSQNKKYFNEEIYQLIKDKIPEGTYGEFTELVYEIILRRSYTFELSKEQIIEDIDNLLKNCNKIQFSSNFKKSTTFGHIVLSKKLIEINSKAFENSKDYEKMYETLTHEIYHAMSGKVTENNKHYTGLEFFNEFSKKSGIALNEVFNEMAADMATYNKTEEDEKNHFRRTKGYPNITFVVPLLADSLGVKLKEFLKVGISSREKLLEFMLSKIPESEKDSFLENFEKFEFHLDQLKKLQNIKNNDLTDDDKKNLENSYIEISNFAINVLYASIINDNRPLTKKLQEEFEYRRDVVSSIIEKAKRKF